MSGYKRPRRGYLVCEKTGCRLCCNVLRTDARNGNHEILVDGVRLWVERDEVELVGGLVHGPS